MRIPDTVERYVLGMIMHRLNRKYNIYTIFLRNYQELVLALNDEEFEKALEVLESGKDSIARDSANSYHTSMFIPMLLAVAPESRRVLKKLIPDVASFLHDYIKAILNGQERPSLDPELKRKLLRYAGFHDERSNAFYFLPTNEEIKKINMDDASYVYSIYNYGLKYDKKNRIIKLFGKPVYKIEDEDVFLASIPIGNEFDVKLVELVEESLIDKVERKIAKIASNLNFTRTYGSLYTSSSRNLLLSSKIEITGDIGTLAGNIGIEVPSDLKKNPIEINISLKRGEEKRTHIKILTKIHNLSNGLKLASAYTEIPFREVDRIDNALGNSINLLLEKTREYENTLNEFRMIAKRRKYTLLEPDEESDEETGEGGYPKFFYSHRNFASTVHLLLNIVHGKTELLAEEVIEAYVDNTENFLRELKQVNDESLSQYIINNEGSRLIFKRAFTIRNRRDIEDFFDHSSKLMSLLKRTERRIEEIKKHGYTGSMDTLLANYLVTVLEPVSSRISDIEQLSESVSKILSNLNIKNIDKILDKSERKGFIAPVFYSNEIIRELVLSNIIHVEENKVVVNGKRLYSILSKEGYDKAEAVGLEKRISWKIMQSIISTMTPRDMTRRIGGKVVWDVLPGHIRKRYLEQLPVEQLTKILSNENLMKVFSISVGTIVEEIIKRGSPDLKTTMIFKYKPQLLGKLHSNARLDTSEGTPAIVVGNYYVQVYNTSKDYTDYIIYRKDKKIGFLYRGRTLVEALMKAIRTYDDAVNKYIKENRQRKIGNLVVILDSTGEPVSPADSVESEESKLTSSIP